MRNGTEVGPRGLSERAGQRLNQTVPDTDPALSVIGAPVYVEDAENVRVTVKNVGANPTIAGTLEKNNFNPSETDGHWETVDAVTLAAIAAGATKTLVVQGQGIKWMRFRASAAAGLGTEVDLAFTGA